MELEAELASSIELRQKLERKVQFLEDENYLLESKHKELKETINSILLAKECFVNAYQVSTCEMKRSIESRDIKINMLSEKINAHILLIDSIRKEAYFVNQVLDNAQRVVDEKEEVVSRLKTEMDKVCAFENLFIEKINELEMKLISNEEEFQRKERVISELQSQLETIKISDQWQSKINEISKLETLVMKEGIIQTLISENKGLRSELGMLEITFKTIQDTMTRMDDEDRVAFSSLMAVNQEKGKEDDKTCRATVEEITAASPWHARIASPLRRENSCESQDNCSTYIQQLDSECSTTQATGAS